MTAAARKRKRNVVKVGSIKIPWSKYADGRTYVDLRSLGESPRTFADHASAIAFARQRARERHNKGADAKPITDEQRVVLEKLYTTAAELAVEPNEIIRAGVASLRRVVHNVPEVVAELLSSKSPRDLNQRYRRGLTSDLKVFAQRFAGDLLSPPPQEIQALADSLGHGASRRNAFVDSVRHLYSFAKKRGYWPSDKPTPAQQVELADEPTLLVEFYAVWEMELFLEHVREEFVPWLGTNAFSGLRHEEIVLSRDAAKKKDPVRWEDFDWDDRAIAVRPETSKTGRARRIPILPNLFDILKRWRDRKAAGPICAGHPGDYETTRIVKLANKELVQQHDIRRVVWRKNALRHSYGSYRMAVIQNEHQLAYEMGNSIEMIRAHYHNPRPKSEAAAWFQLRRELPGNIIQTELFGS